VKFYLGLLFHTGPKTLVIYSNSRFHIRRCWSCTRPCWCLYDLAILLCRLITAASFTRGWRRSSVYFLMIAFHLPWKKSIAKRKTERIRAKNI
jgi:hypothetical protein